MFMATRKSSRSKKKSEKIVLTRGKKKTAIARARIKPSNSGSYKVNKKPVDLIEPEIARKEMLTPIWIAMDVLGENVLDKLDIDVNVQGGGIMGQAEAVKTAVAKGLVEFTESEELRRAYLNYDRSLLVDDIRRKEPKKFMHRGARARFQKSYR